MAFAHAAAKAALSGCCSQSREALKSRAPIDWSREVSVNRDIRVRKTNDALWHPWLRVERLIRAVRETIWDTDQWPVAKLVLRRTLTERTELTRAGWFS